MTKTKENLEPEDGWRNLPLLPLKDVVIFPRMVVPLLVGRPASVYAVEESLASGRPLLLCTQVDPAIDLPGSGDIHEVGVEATILQTLRMPDDTMKVVVEGLRRVRVIELINMGAYQEGRVHDAETGGGPTDDREATIRVALTQFEDYARHTQRISPEIVTSVASIEDAGDLADLICAHLPLRVKDRQELLELVNVDERLVRVVSVLMRENDLHGIERQVRDRVREQMERGQREYYLHEQLKAIHQELGQGEDGLDEYAELRQQIEKAGLPEEARDKALRELARYERMPSMSPEGAIVRTYLEWLAELPWSARTKDLIDLGAAKEQLDKDHYGLEKVKERILEFLAIRKLSKSRKGPILCLVGPPGVGKTSLGQSIATAMGRKFARISLGGVRDEAEIRGHRRTYVGAMPGRIVQSLKRVGVRNPVFVLDEIDKMNMDFRGDPSSALLEVLDPEQNTKFSDHYLEVDFDLHEVFFIATANDEYEIPHPLHDRMEVVHISGYTLHEKERIAKLFLVPKEMTEAGLLAKHIRFTDEAVQTIVQRYTREAGVRELERRIAQVCRKVARKVVEAKSQKKRKFEAVVVDPAMVAKLLGPEEYLDIAVDRELRPGVSVGLAWTPVGGDLLHVETTTMKGKGDLLLTGMLGDVMRESAQAAHTYIRSRAKELGVSPAFYKSTDLHIHVPEGAIPKDGPSAGIPMAVSILGALRGQSQAARVAATGEITLRGRILPVGGIKEKVLAAHRGGIVRIVMPRENEKDLIDVPAEVKEAIRFDFVDTLEDALAILIPARPQRKAAPRKAKRPVKSKKAPARKKPAKRRARR